MIVSFSGGLGIVAYVKREWFKSGAYRTVSLVEYAKQRGLI